MIWIEVVKETSATSPTAHKRPMTKGLKDGVSLGVGSLFRWRIHGSGCFTDDTVCEANMPLPSLAEGAFLVEVRPVRFGALHLLNKDVPKGPSPQGGPRGARTRPA